MKHITTYKTVITALFAAMICVSTMLIRIPIPATGGYANLGDGVILICAFLMHPLCAVIAAGLGSMLADLLAGYASFAPGTLIIKAGVALIAALIYSRFGRNHSKKSSFISMIIAGIIAEAFMVLGYFLYESAIMGVGIAAAGAIPGNIGQGVVGTAAACIIAPVLTRSEEVRSLMHKTWN